MVCIHYCVLSVLPFTLFSWHNVPQPAVRVEISNNLNSVRLSVVEFGFNASFRYNTTTDPQLNSVLRELLWLPRAYCSSFACGFLQLGFGYCRFTTASPLLHTLCFYFPVPPVSTRAIVKKKKRGNFTAVQRLFSLSVCK